MAFGIDLSGAWERLDKTEKSMEEMNKLLVQITGLLTQAVELLKEIRDQNA